MNGINVAVTGYFRTGSSAVVDLLKEYRGVKVVPFSDKSYEHDVFYHHGGLFDLCTLLTHGNTPFSSDKVICEFIKEMKRLNNYNYVWFGSFKKMFGDKFMDLVYELVDSLAKKQKDKTTNHIVKTRFSFIKLCAQIALRILKKRHITNYGVWYVYDKEDCYIALPTRDEVYEAAKKFTSGYFELFDSDEDIDVKIYDHIIWPAQISEFSECFNDNFKVIVVDRDPRDIFTMEKHMPTGRVSHFPIEPNAFAEEWSRTVITEFNNPNVLKIHFEDLVYKYEETVERVEKFLGLNSFDHIEKFMNFVPNKSIENTQVFMTKDEWKNEAKVIEQLLQSFLYVFPYERVPVRKLMFADDGIGKTSI